MTAFDVDLAELRRTVHDLAACQRDLLALGTEIDHAHDRLQLAWSGQARDAEASTYHSWRAACAGMVTALASLRRIAESADGSYSRAAEANVARWQAVAD